MVNRRDLLTAAGTGAAVGLAGCAGLGGGDGTVRMAILTTLSGPNAHYGEETLVGTELAVEEINNSDEILPDTEIEIESYDTEADGEVAISVAREAHDQWGADIIGGPVISSSAVGVAGFANDRDTPFFFTSRDRSLTTGENCHSTTYRPGVCTTESLAGGVATWATENLGGEGYVLYQDYSYGQSNRDWTEEYAEQQGGEVLDSIGLPLDETAFESAIDQIMSDDPDWVFNTFFGGGMVAFINQANSRGFDIPMLTAGIDGALLSEAGQSAFDEAPELYNFEQWSPAIDTDIASAFREDVLDETGGLPTEYMVAPYHNVRFFGDVLHETGGSTDAGEIQNAVEQDGGFEYDGLYEDSVTVRDCDHQAVLPLYVNRWSGIDDDIPWAEFELEETIDTGDVITDCADVECEF